MNYIEFLDTVSTIISFTSVLVLTWGVLLTMVKFIKNEGKNQDSSGSTQKRQVIRAFLGSYILIALEILIAADIIDTIANPSTTEIVLLAVTVVIRTFISFFLNREIKEAQELAHIDK